MGKENHIPIQPTGSTNVVATSGATWQITGLQLEAGTTATPFEHLQYGTQLALCQRYFEVVDTGSANAAYGTPGAVSSGRVGYISYTYNTYPRFNPGSTFSSEL